MSGAAKHYGIEMTVLVRIMEEENGMRTEDRSMCTCPVVGRMAVSQ
jgi:hypothetical protein